jgi:hypothetical protein
MDYGTFFRFTDNYFGSPKAPPINYYNYYINADKSYYNIKESVINEE